jgi:hypothetical protein
MNHQDFAQIWVDAWNSHDLGDILSHYSEDIEITTPMIAMAAGGKESSLKGKESVREYGQKALDKFPDLHFDLIHSTAGVDSVALFYKSIMGKHAVEVMFFNEAGKISRMYAHYD